MIRILILTAPLQRRYSGVTAALFSASLTRSRFPTPTLLSLEFSVSVSFSSLLYAFVSFFRSLFPRTIIRILTLFIPWIITRTPILIVSTNQGMSVCSQLLMEWHRILRLVLKRR